MKKPTSLAEQVREAQKVMSTWSDLQKRTVFLQGTDAYLARKDGFASTPVRASASEQVRRKSHA